MRAFGFAGGSLEMSGLGMPVALVLPTFHHPKGNLFIFVNKANLENYSSVPVLAHNREGKIVMNKDFP